MRIAYLHAIRDGPYFTRVNYSIDNMLRDKMLFRVDLKENPPIESAG